MALLILLHCQPGQNKNRLKTVKIVYLIHRVRPRSLIPEQRALLLQHARGI